MKQITRHGEATLRRIGTLLQFEEHQNHESADQQLQSIEHRIDIILQTINTLNEAYGETPKRNLPTAINAFVEGRKRELLNRGPEGDPPLVLMVAEVESPEITAMNSCMRLADWVTRNSQPGRSGAAIVRIAQWFLAFAIENNARTDTDEQGN